MIEYLRFSSKHNLPQSLSTNVSVMDEAGKILFQE
jgi:hypothetical protein